MSIYTNDPLDFTIADPAFDGDVLNREWKEKYEDIASFLKPDHENLIIAMGSTPASQIDVNFDYLMVGGRMCASGDLTIDITSAGENGLDTGSETASTWYYIWVIAKDDGTKAGLFSVSPTNPTLPAEYAHKRLIGAIYNDSSNNFVEGNWIGKDFIYKTNNNIVYRVSQQYFADVNCSSKIPIGIARWGYFLIYDALDGATGALIRPKGSSLSTFAGHYVAGNHSTECPTDNNGYVQYSTGGSRRVSINITGYKMFI